LRTPAEQPFLPQTSCNIAFGNTLQLHFWHILVIPCSEHNPNLLFSHKPVLAVLLAQLKYYEFGTA
jgi:hypothetical protein